MKLLPIFAAVLCMVSAMPVEAEGAVDNLRDESTEPCINAYYGIGQAVDYTKAYKCFESNKIYEFLIVMQLNGQGVPANIAIAKNLMNEWLKADPDNAGAADETSMQALLTARNAQTSSLPVDYCKDVAQTTYSIGYCTWIQDQLAKQSFDTTMTGIRQKLSADQQALWDKTQTAFLAYAHAEAERGHQMYAGGSAAGTAYSLQQIYIREHFKSLMQSWFVDMKLQPASKQDLASAEMTMHSAYDADIATYKEEYSSSSSDADDFSQTMAEYVSEYENDEKVSQDKWGSLRDLCAELAQSVYKERDSKVDWSTSMKVTLSLNRVSEIGHHPLGDE